MPIATSMDCGEPDGDLITERGRFWRMEEGKQAAILPYTMCRQGQ